MHKDYLETILGPKPRARYKQFNRNINQGSKIIRYTYRDRPFYLEFYCCISSNFLLDYLNNKRINEENNLENQNGKGGKNES